MDGPDFADKLREWEGLIRLHDAVRPDQPVGDSVKVSVLMEQAPNSIKDSVALNIHQLDTYPKMRQA
eukprot:1209143-Alexandrium_andersonii.AAC.1